MSVRFAALMATRPVALPRAASAGHSHSAGGRDGNERLTATVAVILLFLLAAEGVTILRIGGLLSPHVFIGMLLIPPVAVKIGATGWKFASYYRGRREYVAAGPPHPLLRFLAGPAVVVTTLLVFGTGVGLVAGNVHGGLLTLAHKASFVLWLGAMGLHVLVHVLRLPAVVARDWTAGAPAPGRRLRLVLVVGMLALGVVLAFVTLPLAHTWLHGATWGGDG